MGRWRAGWTNGRTEGAGRQRRQSAQRRPRSLGAGMDCARGHRVTGLDLTNGSVRITGKPAMRGERHRGRLHLRQAVIFLVALTIQPQVSHRLSAISGSMPLKPLKPNLNCALASISYASCVKNTVDNGAHTRCPSCLFVLPALCSCMALCPPVVPARCSPLSHATENYCNPVLDAYSAIRPKYFGERMCTKYI